LARTLTPRPEQRRRERLWRRPVGNQIFFAGEALSVLKHGSLPGAYDSGQAAARLVLEALAG
jgi:hypothetical protein